MQAVNSSLKPYWKIRECLTVCNCLLLYNNGIVVPPALRRETLTVRGGEESDEDESIRLVARCEVREFVENCREYAKGSRPKREPWTLLLYPNFHGNKWELIYLSWEVNTTYWWVLKISRSATSTHVIAMLKMIFSRHGLPEVIYSDNGPLSEFAQIAESYGFHRITSIPHYPQSNGEVEHMVQILKRMLKKSGDPYLGFSISSNSWCGLSPSEICMWRRLRYSSLLPGLTFQNFEKWIRSWNIDCDNRQIFLTILRFVSGLMDKQSKVELYVLQNRILSKLQST